jgi:hypothetical protein
MEDEILADAIPAPEPEATVAPEPEVAPEPVKTFSQEEVDALIGKRLARERSKWERQQAPQPAASLPPADNFSTTEEYAQALAEEMVRRQQDAARLDEYREREDGIRDKYEDFDQVAYNPRLPITDAMAQTIQTSEIGPEIAYFLGSNPKEADRISRLTPFVQAKEIGKIEAKLAANPPIKTTTKAPEPIAPVGARSSNASAYDTTDPRSIKTMSTADWIAADRQRQIKKAQSKQF